MDSTRVPPSRRLKGQGILIKYIYKGYGMCLKGQSNQLKGGG